MSPLELEATAEKTQINQDELAATADQANGDAATMQKPVAEVRPAVQGVIRINRLSMKSPTDATESEMGSAVAGRHVGLRYLLQQLLTSGPLVVADLAVLIAVIAIAREFMLLLGVRTGLDLTACFLPLATGFVLISAELGLYPGIRLSPVEEFRRSSMAVTSIFAVWILSMAMMSGGISAWRCLFLASAYGMYLVSLPLCRGAMRRFLAKRSWWGFPTLICGSDPSVIRVYHWLNRNHRLGLRPLGVIADRADLAISNDEPWYLGPWSATHDVAIAKGAYWAIVVPPAGGMSAVATPVAEHLSTIPHIHILSDSSDLADGWTKHQQFEGLSGVQIQQNLMLPLPRLTKRCMDLVASVIGGILLLPLFFYIAVAVKLSSRGPILYGHDRLGKDGRHFKAWKFRSMFQDSHLVLEQYLEAHPELREEWNRDHKLRFDPRVTRIGRFIRKTSLDELPQIWNVIRGEMSLVGPRPIVTAEIVKYGPYYGLYSMVTPGITGLWQVSGRNNTTYEERVELDAYYVRNWSPWLDMYLLIRTIRIVLFADGAY